MIHVFVTLYSVSSEVYKKGIGDVRNSASVITAEDKNALWTKGALGTSSPQILQHTILDYIFALEAFKSKMT